MALPDDHALYLNGSLNLQFIPAPLAHAGDTISDSRDMETSVVILRVRRGISDPSSADAQFYVMAGAGPPSTTSLIQPRKIVDGTPAPAMMRSHAPCQPKHLLRAESLIQLDRHENDQHS